MSELANDAGYAYAASVSTEIGERISASEEKISTAYAAADALVDTKYSERCSSIEKGVDSVRSSIPTKVS